MNARAKSPAPHIKTANAPFVFSGSGQVEKRQHLFTVTPGVDLADALNNVSDLLDMCRDPIYDAAMGHQALEHNPAWLVLHALDSAKAVIDSLQWSAENPETLEVATESKEEKRGGQEGREESAQNGAATPSGQDTLDSTK